MPRTFVIGDIHGALKALKQLIELLRLEKDDRLIFLGDYVDGWSESAQVIDLLITLDGEYSCIFIKGNHDAWCESWLNGDPAEELWVAQGGRATIDSYRKVKRKEKLIHLEFLNRMKGYYIDEQNRLFIHAGYSSMHGPAKERYESNYFWDRTLWEMALSVDKRIEKDSKLYPKRLALFNEIFIGHTPTTNYDIDTPMHAVNVWNVDTGAAFKGKLSALNLDSKEFYQSEIVQNLYPDEKGRNK